MQRVDPVRRILAGLAGIVALIVGTVVTVGVALLALGGALATHAFVRLRGRRLTPLTSWLAAVVSSALVLAVIFAVVVGTTSELSPAAMRAAATQDSATEPPAWVRRVSPSTAESMQRPDPATERLLQSDGFMSAMMILTGVTMILIGGVVAGTIGWGSALLLGFAVLGRRLWRAEPARPTGLDDDAWAAA